MRNWRLLQVLGLGLVVVIVSLCTVLLSYGVSPGYGVSQKIRIFVASSYHREYLWSQSTQAGLCAAMLKFGYLDNQQQIDEFTKNDYVESSKAVIKKEWMDTKRKYNTSDIAQSTALIMKILEKFQPDIVLLGDDNAANYLGNQLLDTDIPVVFWGINGLPIKYGLLDNLDQPGHNVTGIWQSGYLRESLELLHTLVPSAKTFAILACDSETSRPKIKELQALDSAGKIPLSLKDVVVTNSFTTFKKRTLELSQQVDAFFVLNHDTLKDDQGNPVDMLVVGKWYLEHIKKPETSHEDQFVREGMLCTANDSGYNQGYEAFLMVIDILEKEVKPSQMRPRTPLRGPLMINRQRANRLGISLDDKKDVVEEIVEESLAYKKE